MAKNTANKKMKTHKATAKRFVIKRKKKASQEEPNAKIMMRTGGQGHFNSRESGKTGRNKKRDNAISKAMHKTIMRSMPYA
ncbi:MAG: hypothetical protein HOE53_04790 [Candidatus Magasanikbacteria bacterium]|jgi:ribosomal protein L35|nr:hypothetical protein [Candidatus Magasanikbacteria bacterium]